MNLNNKIQTIIKEKNLSIKQIANLIGISSKTFEKKLKDNKKISFDKILKLSVILETSYEILINDELDIPSKNENNHVEINSIKSSTKTFIRKNKHFYFDYLSLSEEINYFYTKDKKKVRKVFPIFWILLLLSAAAFFLPDLYWIIAFPLFILAFISKIFIQKRKYLKDIIYLLAKQKELLKKYQEKYTYVFPLNPYLSKFFFVNEEKQTFGLINIETLEFECSFNYLKTYLFSGKSINSSRKSGEVNLGKKINIENDIYAFYVLALYFNNKEEAYAIFNSNAINNYDTRSDIRLYDYYSCIILNKISEIFLNHNIK